MRGRRRTLGASFRDAARGLWICIKSERNMRVHTAAALYVLFFATFLGLSRGEYALLFAVIGIMITAEAFNTAVEKLCDYVCFEYDRIIGKVKDIAAGAVFISSIVAVCIGVVLLWRPAELWALFLLVAGSPLWLFLLILSALITVIYIIAGPVGIKRYFVKKVKKVK